MYSALAADYHWLYDDVSLSLGSTTPGVRAAIASLAPGSWVLDAACGIGLDAAALARRGFRVSASDGCRAMVDHTRRRVGGIDGGHPVTVVHSDWTRLPAHFAAGTFSTVLCTGNSISHLEGAQHMIETFATFRSLLADDGMLIVDTHDWEVVLDEGDRIEIDPLPVRRRGACCARSYAWKMSDRRSGSCSLEIRLTITDGSTSRQRSYRIPQYPCTRRELSERLAGAGFRTVALDVIPGDDRYTAVARR